MGEKDTVKRRVKDRMARGPREKKGPGEEKMMESLGESGTKIRARTRVKDGKTRGVGDKDKGQEKSKRWKDLRRGGGGGGGR